MGVIGIETIDVGADATALAGPGEPPLGALMPFVAQNPLGPFVPGDQYQIRSEDEGECETARSISPLLADLAGAAGVALASYVQPKTQDRPFAAQPPSVPVADPPSSTFTTSITVTLSAKASAKIHYTTDGSTPTASSAAYSAPLTFTAATTLKAIAVKDGEISEIGTFTYTQATPPAVVTATPGDGTAFIAPITVTLASAAGLRRSTTHRRHGSATVVGRIFCSGPIYLSASDADPRHGRGTGGVNSAVTIFNYTLTGRYRAARGRSRVRDGIRDDPERQPDDPDARRDDLVHGRWIGSPDVQLAEAVHSAAVARVDDDGDGLRDGRWSRQPDRRLHVHEDRPGLPRADLRQLRMDRLLAAARTAMPT